MRTGAQPHGRNREVRYRAEGHVAGPDQRLRSANAGQSRSGREERQGPQQHLLDDFDRSAQAKDDGRCGWPRDRVNDHQMIESLEPN